MMISLLKNEFYKIKISKIIFTYIIYIISLIIINKYSKSNILDMSYNLIPFVGIVLIILFSGIICEEINSGNMRYYLTKPFKRYKIYSAKILVILIYLIISYLIIITTSSIIYGSIEYKYFFKFFIHMIPIIFISSLVLYLSTTYKNHVLVSCISILLLTFSLTISQILFGIKINIVEYTFLPYLDFSIFNDRLLINQMNKELMIHLSINRGIIIDLLSSIILFALGLNKFKKKDIKN